MKKKSSEKHVSLCQKNKRFHKFFLRWFLICLLAGVTVTAVLFQQEFVDDSNAYESDIRSKFTSEINSLTKTDDEDGSIIFNKMLRKNGVQHLINSLAIIDPFDIDGYGYSDSAAILIHPGKYEKMI